MTVVKSVSLDKASHEKLLRESRILNIGYSEYVRRAIMGMQIKKVATVSVAWDDKDSEGNGNDRING